MKPADVGAMRERVTIRSQAQSVDPAGQITTTWSDVATTWARVEPMKAWEQQLAGRDQGARGYKMTIRYRTDIDTNSRVVWRGRNFDVQGVLDRTEQRVFLSVDLFERNA